MSETIQHDPRTKQQIKDALHEYLYNPVEKATKAKLSALILRNSSIVGNSNTAFSYKGITYSIEPNPSYKKVNRLHSTLHSAMNDHLKEVGQLNNVELPYVIGFITSVLNASNSLQDYINVFPSAIHAPLQKLVSTCPCRLCTLTPEATKQLQEKNQAPITMIKKRLVINLLI